MSCDRRRRRPLGGSQGGAPLRARGGEAPSRDTAGRARLAVRLHRRDRPRGLLPVVGADLEELRRAAEVALDATLREVVPDPGESRSSGVSSRARRQPRWSTSPATPICSSSARAATAASPVSCSARSASSARTTRPALS